MPSLEPENLPGPGQAALRRWRDAILSAAETTPISDLGDTGVLLTHALRSEPTTLLLQLIDRVIRATQEPVYTIRYTSRSQLVHDIDVLLRYEPIAESRRPVLDGLTDLIERAHRGRGGSLVVAGASGIGKTFLWRAFERRYTQPADISVYHKSPQAGEAPLEGYGAILEQLLQATATARGVSPGELATGLLRHEQIDAGGASVLLSVLSGYYPDLAQGASHRTSFAASPTEVLTAALLVVAGWASESGAAAVIITVDDIQWADDQSVAIWHALSQNPGSIALVLMTRPEGLGQNAAIQAVPRVSMRPLTRSESQTLARALRVPTDPTSESTVETVHLGEESGSPFQIAEDARQLLQVRGLAGSVPSGAQDLAADTTTSTQLRGISASAQAVIDSVALLFPPVERPVVMSALEISEERLTAALHECFSAGILLSRGDTITFSHDRLERAARLAALHSGRWTVAAGRVLARRSREGDYRATYVLARLLAGPHASSDETRIPAESVLGRQECAFILRTAAARALDLAIADDAATFVAVAVERFGDACTRGELAELMHLGHRAAFLHDNGHAMSHYFRGLARYGTASDLVMARHIWISRCYTKLWIRGALKIGKNILREHGVTDALTMDGAQTTLGRFRPDRVYHRILAQPADLRPESLLIGRTCAELLLTVMSIDHEAIYLFAVVLLRHGLAHGPTPYTALGFVFWAMAEELDSRKPRRRDRILEHARSVVASVPTASLSAAEVHRVRVLLGILTLPWERLTPKRYRHLLPLYREGLSCGSYEMSAHAIHVYCYAPLFHGYPLRHVYTTIEHYRAGVTAHGLTRISRAMGKFAQAAWVLMGETDTPLHVSGHICSETELEAELQETGDTLGLAGLQFLRALLAAYHGTPEQALDQLRLLDQRSRIVRFLIDATWSWFLHAMTAWKLGGITEARAFSARLKPYSDSAPGNHRHTAVEAEYLVHRGLRRLAHRRFRTATDLAVANGHLHDAALIAERHACLVLDWAPGSAAAIERLVAAESLYTQWGARRKVEYLRSQIEAYRRRNGQMLEGVVTTGADQEGDDPGDDLIAVREALAQTREYTRVLFSSVDEALLLVQPDGSVLFHNAGAAPYLVQTGQDQWSVEPQLLRTIGVLYAGAGGEVEWNGRTLTYAIRSVSSGHTQEALAAVLRDVTDEQRRQRQMIVADRLSSLGLMSATVAHEVGNPNHIIALHGYALLEGAQTPEVREAASGILEGSQKITEVVSLITRYGRGGSEGEAEWADPGEIGSRVERFTRIMARQYTSHLEFSHPEPVPSFRGYPALIEQALVNLVKNSCEALTSREQRVRIEVRREDDSVLFKVCDQGQGFTNTIGQKPKSGAALFATTKQHSGGTGLGISVVRSVAERHAGSLRYTYDGEFTTIAELRIPLEIA